MKRSRKVTAAIALGTAGIMALSACAAGSDQAQSDRDAAASNGAASATSSPDEIPTLPIAKPAGGLDPNFDDVVMTHNSPSQCTTKQSDDKTKLLINCKKVGMNLFGDNIWIKVPDYHYRINAKLVPSHPDTHMRTTQRDWANIMVHQSDEENVTYNSPYKDSEKARTTPWILGIDSSVDSTNLEVLITISYLEK